MTALERYQRLEGPGLWAADADAQRRDVVVRFGEASLVIVDDRSDMVLSHWSLAAIRRVNPGETPACFVPHDTSAPRTGEVLEIEDALLVDALDTVLTALQSPYRRRARGRRIALALAGLAMLAAAVLGLPEILRQHTAGVVPMAKRIQIGQMIVEDMRDSGIARACVTPGGTAALSLLASQLFDTPPRLLVLEARSGPGFATTHLPGRVLLIDARLLNRLDSPDALAGHLLAEALRSAATDPLPAVLRHAGTRTTFRLLTQGEMAPQAVAGYGARLLAARPEPVDPQALQARIDRTGLDPAALNAGIDTPEPLPELQPPPAPRTEPLITDGDWLRIQSLCDG